MQDLKDFPAFFPSVKRLEQIKRAAKDIKIADMTHRAALDLAAKADGYRNFNHALNQLAVSAKDDLWIFNSVSCVISQPEGYMSGAWLVEARLSAELQKQLGSDRLLFHFPKIPKRIVTARGEYGSSVDGKLGGQFVDGVWIALLSKNGLEEESPPSPEAWRQAFMSEVLARLWGLSPG